MARYGSERIRGHGIPEAIEAILIQGSRVQPRVAILKPLSSAISIGSGGPFGAEGPIIMTGGAFGSLLAQFMHLSSAERKTLLVAGAAAGMSATFASPVAATLLAVELPAGARWRRSAKVEAHDQRRNVSGAKWSRVTHPDHWNGTNERFNESNAKLVCDRCHCEVPFNFRCQTCGSSKFVLATAALMPGIFCRGCHEGQWHWDCPRCGRRQHFSRAFFYDKRAIGQTARNAA
jgi:Voltage gated chloride channel